MEMLRFLLVLEVRIMTTDEFLTRVKDRAGLVDLHDAQRACEVVFQILRALLAHSTGDRIAGELPIELKKLWESGIVDHVIRSMSGVEKMNMLKFLDRVREDARLHTRDQAVIVAQAVLATLNEQLSHAVKKDMVREFPNDVHEFWKSSFSVEEEGAVYASAHGSWFESEMEMTEEGEVEASSRIADPPNQKETRALPEETGVRGGSVEAGRIDLPEGQYGSDKIGPSAAEVYRSDQQLKNEIEDLLNASDEVDAEDIHVNVQQGNVTLSGTVGSQQQKIIAECVASDALGVVSISNELEVS